MVSDLLELIENPKDISKISCIKTAYEDFERNTEFITKILGSDARGFFIEKSAYIIFEQTPNILMIINKKEGFNKEDFYVGNLNIEIEGKSNRRINNFFTMLKNDLISYKFQLMILVLLYIIIFCTAKSLISLKELNTIFVDITSIFIGMLFVFATMFYKEDELEEAIKNGKAQEIFLTDKYIFILAMISMLLVIISNGILEYEVNNSLIQIKDFIKQNYYYIYWFIKYGISEILTGISIVLNYICFRSIIDYYLNKIKAKAINRHIKIVRDQIIDDKIRKV